MFLWSEVFVMAKCQNMTFGRQVIVYYVTTDPHGNLQTVQQRSFGLLGLKVRACSPPMLRGHLARFPLPASRLAVHLVSGPSRLSVPRARTSLPDCCCRGYVAQAAFLRWSFHHT